MKVNGQDLTYLLSVLDALSKYCLDAEIKDGKIRIRSNNRIGLYDIDLPEPWSISINIPMLKVFIDLVKLFIPEDDKTLQFDIVQQNNGAKKLHLEDDLSQMDIALGDIQNKFVTDDELQNIGFQNKTHIASFTLNGKAIKRLKSLQKNFAVSIVSINSTKNKLQIESESKTRFAQFNIDSEIINSNDLPELFKFSFLALDYPFDENEPLKINLYKLPNGVYTVGVNQHNTSIYSSAIKQ